MTEAYFYTVPFSFFSAANSDFSATDIRKTKKPPTGGKKIPRENSGEFTF